MWFTKSLILQIVSIFPVCLLFFAGGMACGWVAPILSRFKNSDSDFSLSTEACSLIASLHYVGKGIASIFAFALIDRVGRIPIFVFSSLGCFIMWLAVLFTKSVPLHYLIRILFGLTSGSMDIAVSIYIGENSSPQLRAIYGSMCIVFFYLGELLAFIVATYLSYETVAIIFATMTFFILFSMFLLRETAQFLLTKGQVDKAENNFFSIRGTGEATKREFEEIKQSVWQQQQQQQKQKKINFSSALGLLLGNGMRATCLVNLLMYLTGYAPVNAMSSLAFSAIGNLGPNELTMILGAIQLISVLFSSTIIEKIGRRPLLIGSSAVCCLCHSIVGLVYYFQELGSPLPLSSWMLFVFITAYSVLVAAIFLPICTIIRGELLSPRVKSIGGCISIVLGSILSTGMTSAFLMVAQKYGMKTNFFFFAAMSATMSAYVYVDLPETKGLTLTQIQKSMKKSKKANENSCDGQSSNVIF